MDECHGREVIARLMGVMVGLGNCTWMSIMVELGNCTWMGFMIPSCSGHHALTRTLDGLKYEVIV